MVVHVHAGEGFPIFNKAEIFREGQQSPFDKLSSDSEADLKGYIQAESDKWFGMKESYFQTFCAEAKKDKVFDSNSLPILKRTDGGDNFPNSRLYKEEPLHYESARKNMDALLTNIENIKNDKTLDKIGNIKLDKIGNIKFQIGHATHATLEQAKKMKTLNVAADIDLSSNLATRALNWDDAQCTSGPREEWDSPELVTWKCGKDVLFITDGRSNARSHATAAELMEKRQELAQLFVRHGVVRLLLEGVDVTIGSDGIGIEHSGHEQDYDIVKAIVQFWNEFNAEEPWVSQTSGLSDQEAWNEFKDLKNAYPSKKLDAEVLFANQYKQQQWMEKR